MISATRDEFRFPPTSSIFKAYVDKHCLKDGEPWADGFSNGLASARRCRLAQSAAQGPTRTTARTVRHEIATPSRVPARAVALGVQMRSPLARESSASRPRQSLDWPSCGSTSNDVSRTAPRTHACPSYPYHIRTHAWRVSVSQGRYTVLASNTGK